MENTCDSTSVKGKIIQFVKFSIVGVSNTVISEGVYAVLIFFRMHYLPASFIGFVISVLNAYYWNNRFVFKEEKGDEKRVWWKVLLKTYVAYIWGYIATACLLIFWIEIVDIAQWMEPLEQWFAVRGMESIDSHYLAGLLAALLNYLITVPMNYLLNKYWAFQQKKCVNKEE